jgi:DNA-binding SARP family transcriptional activator
MLRLRTFGTLSIEGREGPLTGAATQRRRLALLALLASAGARGTSRDKVVACLWPESDADHARHALAQLLYSLRRDLPDGALLADGPVLRLNAELISSDVGDFEAALDAGGDREALARAVSLYVGPFLDGFFLGDVPEFERWVEGERTRLAKRATAALEQLAAAATAAGEHGEAIRWWRQLAAHDPLSSRVALSLMQALAAAGDRVGAIQHARVHEALVRQELDAAPDAAITALAARLREEPTAAPATRPTTTPAAAPPGAGWPGEARERRTWSAGDDDARAVDVDAAMEGEITEEHELDAAQMGYRTAPWRLLTTTMMQAIPPAWLTPGAAPRLHRRAEGLLAAVVALLALTAIGVWVAAMR